MNTRKNVRLRLFGRGLPRGGGKQLALITGFTKFTDVPWVRGDDCYDCRH
jgi:hypothetical protein